MTDKKKRTSPTGNSRAAQNRKIRREALREELATKEYLRQVESIAKRLDPDAKNAFEPEQVPMVKSRADIYLRLLDKCLPSLRPIDLPVSLALPAGGTLTERAEQVFQAVAEGQLSSGQGAQLLQALTSVIRVIEADDLERRLSKLEEMINE